MLSVPFLPLMGALRILACGELRGPLKLFEAPFEVQISAALEGGGKEGEEFGDYR